MKERYLNLSNFNNSNAITKKRSGSTAINTTKWYNPQEDKNIVKEWK